MKVIVLKQDIYNKNESYYNMKCRRPQKILFKVIPVLNIKVLPCAKECNFESEMKIRQFEFPSALESNVEAIQYNNFCLGINNFGFLLGSISMIVLEDKNPLMAEFSIIWQKMNVIMKNIIKAYKYRFCSYEVKGKTLNCFLFE